MGSEEETILGVENGMGGFEGRHIPMVPMIEVRRKFLAGTISVLSLECHSSFIRLLRWSREVVAAILYC
jgi:hypothetical protein